MKYLAVIFMLVLVGCGSSSDSDSNRVNARNATLADIVGVWDNSVEFANEVDEMYSVIKEDGSFIDYDYYGDSADNNGNCYEQSELKLIDQGEGDFLIVAGGIEFMTIKITISGDTMYQSTTSFPSVRTDRVESDFTPLCDDT